MSGSGSDDLGAVVEAQACVLLVRPEHGAGEAAAAVERGGELDAGEVAGEAVPVLGPGQRPVDARRADFQRPGGGQRVLDVEHGAEGDAEGLAIGDAERGAVGALGHHLHGRPLAPEHGDAHQLVAQSVERGRDQAGDAVLQRGGVGCGAVQTKKAAREGHPPSSSGA